MPIDFTRATQEILDDASLVRRMMVVVALLIGLTLAGTLGFRVFTESSWVDSLYLAVNTMTTLGSEPMKLGDGGKLFVVCYLAAGLGVFTYSAFQLGNWIVGAEMRRLLERRRMQKAIGELRDHYIVCGLGRMGTIICQYLEARGRPFVAIESNPEVIQHRCAGKKWLYIEGDATNDDALLQAGIRRARALASVLSTDADNVYVVLSARMLAANLQIVARASDQKAIEKMERAGATRIVSPFTSGAVKIARFMLNPSMEDFLELVDSHGRGLELAEIEIGQESPYVGKKLTDTDFREKGVIVIGIRRAGGDHIMPPPASTRIESGDCLMAFGNIKAVNEVLSEFDSTDG